MSQYNPNHVPEKHYFLIGVKIIVVNAKGEILTLRRSDKVSSPHTIDFLGGGVDAHESPYDAAVREAYEETNISLESVELFTSKLVSENGEDAIILGFSATVDDPSITLSWEHESYEWMSPEALAGVGLRDLHSSLFEEFLKKSH